MGLYEIDSFRGVAGWCARCHAGCLLARSANLKTGGLRKKDWLVMTCSKSSKLFLEEAFHFIVN